MVTQLFRPGEVQIQERGAVPALSQVLTTHRTSTIIHLDVKVAASIWRLGGFFSWAGDKGYPTKEIS